MNRVLGLVNAVHHAIFF